VATLVPEPTPQQKEIFFAKRVRVAPALPTPMLQSSKVFLLLFVHKKKFYFCPEFLNE
jgi:hypothetical protein